MNGYSGRFVLRIPSELHKKLTDISTRQNASLNQICILLLNKGLAAAETKPDDFIKFDPVIEKLKSRFKDKLIGVALFGSQVKGEATASSDIDMLVVLDDSVSLNRALYSWWDSEMVWNDGELNPHFILYPKDIQCVGGLWFEVALSGKIIYQKDIIIDQLFSKLKKFVADGGARRYISNGHPYWIKRGQDEK